MAANTSAAHHTVLAASMPAVGSCWAASSSPGSPLSAAAVGSVAACLLDSLRANMVDIASGLAARLTFTRIIVVVYAFLIAAFLADCALKPRYPRSLPRVGYGDSVFATLRNWLGYVFYFNDWVDEGYNKVWHAGW